MSPERELHRQGFRNVPDGGARPLLSLPERDHLSPEDRKTITEAYLRGKGSFRELAKRYETSIGTVQRCALAYQKVFSTHSITR